MNKQDRALAAVKNQLADLQGIGIARTIVGTGFAGVSGVVAEKVSPGVAAGAGAGIALLGASKVLPKSMRPVAVEIGKASWYSAVGVKASKVSANIDLSLAKAKVASAVERISTSVKNGVNGVANGAGKHVEAAPASL